MLNKHENVKTRRGIAGLPVILFSSGLASGFKTNRTYAVERSYQGVRGRFIAAQDNFQRPMNRATTVGPWGPVMFRREQRSLFPTEVRNS